MVLNICAGREGNDREQSGIWEPWASLCTAVIFSASKGPLQGLKWGAWSGQSLVKSQNIWQFLAHEETENSLNSVGKIQHGQNKNKSPGNSLAAEWLGLCTLTVQGLGSIPSRGTKIPQVMWQGQKHWKIKQHGQYTKISFKKKYRQKLEKGRWYT